MWVKVTESSFPFFKGTLDNEPEYNNQLQIGASIDFESQHIIEVIRPKAKI